jgi:EpsG family
MQLYWLPLISSAICMCAALTKRPWVFSRLFSQIGVIVGVGLTLVSYQGMNSDWYGYRLYVDNCSAPGCTYFEPGYDFLTYLAAETIGFDFLKCCLFLSVAITVAIVSPDGESTERYGLISLAVVAAMLPLMLGAIRQTIAIPLVVGAMLNVSRVRYLRAGMLFLLACTMHLSSAIVFAGFIWVSFFISAASTHYRFPSLGRVLFMFVSTKLLVYVALVFLVQLVFGEGGVERLGATHSGTEFIATGSDARDIAILFERFLLSLLALEVLRKQQDSVLRFLSVLTITGSLVFFTIYDLDRNIAGRSLAIFRLGDIAVLGASALGATSGKGKTLAIYQALFVAVVLIVYVFSKSYFTLATVGFFDE